MVKELLKKALHHSIATSQVQCHWLTPELRLPSVGFLRDVRFPFNSQKHGCRWIAFSKLFLGVDKCVKLCMHSAM